MPGSDLTMSFQIRHSVQGYASRGIRILLSWYTVDALKGQCHEIFDFWFFSWISFPQASEYTTTAISNFFENSRRYLRLKVHHRCQRHWWQMEKIFKQKNFNNFVWAPLGSRVNIYIKFSLQVHFKVSAAWYCSHYLPPAANLPPVSLTPVANLPPVSTTQGELVAKFAGGVIDTGGNLPPVSLTPAANLPPVVHLDLRKSLRIFEKIRNDPNVIFSLQGLGGRWFMKKTWSKKSRDTVPLSITPAKSKAAGHIFFHRRNKYWKHTLVTTWND